VSALAPAQRVRCGAQPADADLRGRRPMMPSDRYLLDGVRRSLDELSLAGSAGERDELVQTMQRSLDELLKRQDRARVDGLLARGQALRARCGAQGGGAGLVDLQRALASYIDTLDDAATRDAILQWEADIAAPRSPSAEDTSSRSLNLAPDALTTWFRALWPHAPNLAVERVRRLPGGFSKVTAIVDIAGAPPGAESIVIRAEQDGSPFLMDGSDVANEYHLLRYAHRCGLPVAEPLGLETDATRLGARFLVSRRAAGVNHGDVYGTGASLSADMVRELVQVLARIHATPIQGDDLLVRASHLARWSPHRTVSAFVPAYIDYWEDIARRCGIDHSPALAWTFAWLRANQPGSDAPPVLIHGDYGLHNVMMKDGKITAVLDWEASHLGDPHDEFFLFSLSMSRFVDRSTLLQWYGEAGGHRIDAARLAYFDVMSCMRGLVVSYGSLTQPERSAGSNIKTCQIGFKHLAPHLAMLRPLIEQAEALLNSKGGVDA
ncbi:MAG TPA: phosphotransferase family protein, partial [Nevskiaceae bacterium]|nr:phosphotransferase family protein [Nevskiaceae bacterium]